MLGLGIRGVSGFEGSGASEFGGMVYTGFTLVFEVGRTKCWKEL